MTVSLDKPEQIGAWRVLSAISQLTSEISTGHNWYGRTSVYVGVRMNFIDGLPPRATLQNKCLALYTFLSNLPQEILDGPVCTRAAKVLADKMAEKDWVLSAE
jgi:hypothetical protein